MYRPLVKSAYQKNKYLISQPKHMLWVRDGSFEHPKHMLKLMGKKIFNAQTFFISKHAYLGGNLYVLDTGHQMGEKLQ